jgi:integrase
MKIRERTMKTHLTKRTVDALEFSLGCDYLAWDAKLTGFGVRVTEHADKSGKTYRRKTFVVGLRPRGAKNFQRLSLGTYGPMTVDQARDEALRHLSSASTGNDPRAARKAARAERTVREFGAAYLDDVRAHRKPSTAREYGRLWDKHVLPQIGGKKASEVSLAETSRLHRSMHRTPYLANRVAAMLGAFFTFVSKEGARPIHDNPAHGIEFYPEKGRERFLTPQEFRRLGEALARAEREGLPPAPEHQRKPKSDKTAKHRPKNADKPIPANPLGVAAVRLLALTGCREKEILSLRWDAVDFERGHLRFADSKTGKSIRPLAQAAAEILAALPRVKGTPYVLPGARSGEHLKEIKRLWHAVRHAADLQSLRLHDLRHSFASVPAASGESLLVVRSLLGHKRVATTERYAHLGDDPVRRAANRAAGDIAGWLGGE